MNIFLYQNKQIKKDNGKKSSERFVRKNSKPLDIPEARHNNT